MTALAILAIDSGGAAGPRLVVVGYVLAAVLVALVGAIVLGAILDSRSEARPMRTRLQGYWRRRPTLRPRSRPER